MLHHIMCPFEDLLMVPVGDCLAVYWYSCLPGGVPSYWPLVGRFGLG